MKEAHWEARFWHDSRKYHLTNNGSDVICGSVSLPFYDTGYIEDVHQYGDMTDITYMVNYRRDGASVPTSVINRNWEYVKN